jgi:AcrR family transcriptional regulator
VFDLTHSELNKPLSRKQKFERRHQALIATAAELISEIGTRAFSVSHLAKSAGVDRSIIYNHFDSREGIIAAVRERKAREDALNGKFGDQCRAGFREISVFVEDNPIMVKELVNEYFPPASHRSRNAELGKFMAKISQALSQGSDDYQYDAEVYCTLMLTAASIAPKLFKNEVRPTDNFHAIVERFTLVQDQVLKVSNTKSVSLTNELHLIQ